MIGPLKSIEYPDLWQNTNITEIHIKIKIISLIPWDGNFICCNIVECFRYDVKSAKRHYIYKIQRSTDWFVVWHLTKYAEKKLLLWWIFQIFAMVKNIIAHVGKGTITWWLRFAIDDRDLIFTNEIIGYSINRPSSKHEGCPGCMHVI